MKRGKVISATLTAALQQIAVSPLLDPMSAAIIATFLRGDTGEELLDLAHARASEFQSVIREQRGDEEPWRLTSTTAKLRTSALAAAHYAIRDALSGRIGNAERLAVAAAKRLARALKTSGVSA